MTIQQTHSLRCEGGVDETPEKRTAVLQAPSASLTAETIQCSALPLKRVHHIHGCDSLSAGVLSVCHRIADDRLQEHL
jgi:cell division inhibitor SulA